MNWLRRMGWVTGIVLATGLPGAADAQAPAQTDGDIAQELAEIRAEVRELRRAGEPVPPELMEHFRDLARQQADARRLTSRSRRERESDPDTRAEYIALKQEIRDLQANGQAVPPDLADRERELSAALTGSRDRGIGRSGPRRSRGNDDWAQRTYNEVGREIAAMKQDGQFVPPELTALGKALLNEVRIRTGPDRAGDATRFKREMDRLTRQITNLNLQGQPVPESLRQKLKVVRQEWEKAQGATAPPAAGRTAEGQSGVQLDDLLQDINRVDDRGAPATEPLRGGGTGGGNRRSSAEELERKLANLEAQMDRFEDRGREIPESLIRQAEAIADQLERGEFDDAAPDDLGTDAGRDRGRPGPEPGAGRFQSPEDELERLEELLARFEDAQWEPPDGLIARYEALTGRTEGRADGPIDRPEPFEAAPLEGAAPEDVARQRDEDQLRDLRERVARVEGQGLAVASDVHERIAELERNLATAGDRPPGPVAQPGPGIDAYAPEQHQRDTAQLEKFNKTVRQLEASGQPIPAALQRTTSELEQRLAAAPPAPPAFEPSPDDEDPEPSGQNREIIRQLETTLRGVQDSIDQLRQAGANVPPDLLATEKDLRKALAKAHRSGGNKSSRAKPTKSLLEQRVVPFESWGAYVDEVIAVYGFDEMQKSACRQMLTESQERARPLLSAEAGRPGALGAQRTVSPETQRLVDVIFEELKGRTEYLITPSQRDQAEARQRKNPRSNLRRNGKRDQKSPPPRRARPRR